jgi:ComF family protein
MRPSVTQRISMKFFQHSFIPRTIKTMATQLLASGCALCGRHHAGVLCLACRKRHIANFRARCRCCAITLPGTQTHCSACAANPPSFDASFAATDYAAPIDTLVQALKFGAHLPLAAAFADLLMAIVPREAVTSASVMMAVPLSAERIKQRGFNQAHEIAKPIARAWRLPLATELCVRIRDTEPQSLLPLAQRRGNMRGAFGLMRRDIVVGQHVLLVDDVMTTGETLEALAATLKRNGAARVTNLVFARTPAR